MMYLPMRGEPRMLTLAVYAHNDRKNVAVTLYSTRSIGRIDLTNAEAVAFARRLLAQVESNLQS